MKQVKKSPHNHDFYFTIIDVIKRTSKLPNYKTLGFKTLQNLEYYLKPLRIDGIIEKIGYGTWKINEERADQFKFVAKIKKSPMATKHNSAIFTSLKFRIRAHGFVISFQIPKIEKWERRSEWLQKNKIPYTRIGKLYEGQSILFRGQKVWLCQRNIVIYQSKEKSYFSRSAEEGKKYALYDFMQLMVGLENLFGISLRVNGKFKFKIGRHHYGKIKDELAMQFNREGKKLHVSNERGTWLIIDDSWGLGGEKETVHQETAVADMDKVIIPFYNSLKEHFESTGESVRIDNVMETVRGVARNQQVYAENIESHIGAIRQLGDAVANLSSIVGQLQRNDKFNKGKKRKRRDG